MNCLYHQRTCSTNWPVFLDIFLGLFFLSPSQLYEPLQFSIRNFCLKWSPAQTCSPSSCSVNTYSLVDNLKGSVYEDCPSSLLYFTTFSNLVFLPVFDMSSHIFFIVAIYGKERLSKSICTSSLK